LNPRRRPTRQPTWICATTGRCLCSGTDGDCHCQHLAQTVVPQVGPVRDAVRVDMCSDCKAAMICIDFATGELLSVKTEVELR
jgi:hypothetical protein